MLTNAPRIQLAHLPTPLDHLPRLSAVLGGPRIYVKRDDCTGLGGGGNKVRKLEFLLGDALARGADAIVTGGVVQSNHVRQTAAACAKIGLPCHVALFTGRVADVDADYAETGNAFLTRLFGARCVTSSWSSDRRSALASLAEQVRRDGGRPYVIPYGGSDAVGALGYVHAALELVGQLRGLNLSVDALVTASGSGGTQAGLVAGFAAAGSPIRIVGIDVDGEPERVHADVSGLIDALSGSVTATSVELNAIEVAAGFAAGGYGRPDDRTVEAVRLAATLEGLVLDPVYSGPAMAGLIEFIRQRRFRKNDTVLFLHTGGAPALFAYRSRFTSRSSTGPGSPVLGRSHP